jgi:two-component system, OmpR family, aerobic respiration control sensor histidine kinase ArcB
MTAIESSFDRENLVKKKGFSGPAEAAMLTHDIRTSLNDILGGLCTIDMSALPDAARIQLERVHAASLVLASLVSQAFGDSGDLTSARLLDSCVDLDNFQSFLRRRWRGAADSRNLHLILCVEPDLPVALDCSTMDLSRMVGNLLSNSIRHTTAGWVRVDMANAPGGGMNIVVSDTGPGVDASVLQAVAEPTFGDALCSDARRRLGLQIVKCLASELGGHFSLRNAPGGGLVAAIWLPEQLCIREKGRKTRMDALPGRTAFPALAGRRVLLAEDNPTNQMVATQILNSLDADVTVTSDGVEALEAFAQRDFDIVVVDIEMPRLSGLDVIRAIRALPDRRSRIPIVALTAYALQEHKERIARAGANGLISKPITGIDELARALCEHLESDREAPEATQTEITGPGDAREAQAIDRAVYDTLIVAVGLDMRTELLDRVLADLDGARDDLEDALDPIDLNAIRSATHILISVGGAIGASRVLASARAVNACAHGEDLDRLPEGVRECIGALDQAIAFVEGERRRVGTP